MAERHGIDAEELLAHAGWLRALALRLARDPDDAEDLVQETWIASMRRSPDEREKVRPWLSKILVNTFRMRLRSDTRRTAREEASHVTGDHAPGSDTLVARAELHQKLVDLVLKLAEPYRSTVLLHFCEGVSLADIARTHDVPAGTVRWRLKYALDRLRTQLDEDTGGRKQWAVPLLAFSKGFIVAQKTSKLVAVAVLLLLLLVAGGIVLHRRGTHDASSSSGGGAQGGGGGALVAGHEGAAGGTTGNSDKAIPAWLAQPDVAARRIAGRVTFNGAPVAGATVELASLASEAGLVAAPRKTTDASGAFDFGTQLAMEWSVRASAPGKTGATIELDLRDATSRPAPDKLELRLGTCSAAIFGTVRDASGGSIASARLTRLNVDGPAMGPTGSTSVPGGPSVVTDTNGAYELCAEAKWPGWVSVDVSAEGYGAIVFTGLVPGRIRVAFALVPEATIVGRVVDGETGQPVAHAYVFVPAGPPGSETTAQRATFSDEAGKFKIDRVAPGPHSVLAQAAGYVATQRAVPVTIDAGQTSIELVIRLEHGSTIRGFVREDQKPVAGAHVSFVTEDAWRKPVAVSQNDGSFVLANVPLGTIQFTAHPYDVITPETFLVSQPEHEGVVLDVKELGAIVGRVTRDQKPVSGAHLYLNGPNERDLSPVIADADGHYEVHGLRPGPWTVGASSEQHGAFGTEPKPVQVQLGKTSEVNIDLEFAASIAGKVVDQNGAPVPGIALLFRHTQADDAGWAVTNVDGTFRAAMMTGGGQYTTMVRLRPLSNLALRPAGGGEFPLITLSDGASAVTGIVLAVQIDHMTISGKVVDAAGGPVPDARVIAELIEGNGAPRFWRGLQDPAATTDVDGKFAIDDLLDGTYALRARSSTGGEATFLGVRAGTKDLSIVLSEPGAIEGTIAGFKSTPQISAFRRASTAAPVFASPQGTSFVLRDLSPGTYMVTARSATEAASATVTVDAATTSRVTLTSTGSGIVAGHVIEFRSHKPVEGMTCSALPRIENATSAVGSDNGVLTNSQGEYQIAQAPAGEIVIHCEGLRGQYSDGSRLLTLQSGKKVDVDVPVVAIPYPTPISELGANFQNGALVPSLVRVVPGGPAALAGLQNGDVIVSVDGTSITELSPNGVWVLITHRTVGSKVKLGVTRAGKSITAEVTLGTLH